MERASKNASTVLLALRAVLTSVPLRKAVYGYNDVVTLRRGTMMPKQLIAIAAAFVLMFAIAGCSSGSSSAASSSNQASAPSVSAEASTSSASPLFTEQSWPAGSHVVEEVPVPEFSVGIDSLNTSDNMVSATWNGVEDQEVVDYVSALQNAGFTNNVIENKSSTNYSYNAYNNESIADATTVNLSYTAATADHPSILLISVGRIR